MPVILNRGAPEGTNLHFHSPHFGDFSLNGQSSSRLLLEYTPSIFPQLLQSRRLPHPFHHRRKSLAWLRHLGLTRRRGLLLLLPHLILGPPFPGLQFLLDALLILSASLLLCFLRLLLFFLFLPLSLLFGFLSFLLPVRFFSGPSLAFSCGSSGVAIDLLSVLEPKQTAPVSVSYQGIHMFRAESVPLQVGQISRCPARRQAGPYTLPHQLNIAG